MSLSFIKPLGYYPPLLWDESKSIDGFSLRGLIIVNFLIRFLVYPFNFIFSGITTIGFIGAAIFCNLIWLLGGMCSNFWSANTKALNQIALIRLPWLLFDGLGFLWNQGKLFAGLFYTPLATSVINDLKDFTEPLTQTNLFHWTWEEPHQKLVKKLSNFLHNHELHMLRMIVCTLVAEPVDSISCAFRMQQGVGTMNNYGLNPVKLTDIQAQYPPLLCIHGNFHNQSAWLPLAEYFQKNEYPGAIFTLNLPAGKFTHADSKLINQKIESIMSCYKEANVPEEKIKLNLIGHSRGATLAYYAGFKNFETTETHIRHKLADNTLINKTILIGNTISAHPDYRKSKPTYINGRYDTLLFFKSSPEEIGGSLHNTGHLGLLSNSDVLEECYSTIVNDPEFYTVVPSI